MVGQVPLEDLILVRVQAPQQIKLKKVTTVIKNKR